MMEYLKIITTSGDYYESKKSDIANIHAEINNLSLTLQNYSEKKYGFKVGVTIYEFYSDPTKLELERFIEGARNRLLGKGIKIPYLCLFDPENENNYEFLVRFEVNQEGYPILAQMELEEIILNNLEELQTFIAKLLKNFWFFTKLEKICDHKKLDTQLKKKKEDKKDAP